MCGTPIRPPIPSATAPKRWSTSALAALLSATAMGCAEPTGADSDSTADGLVGDAEVEEDTDSGMAWTPRAVVFLVSKVGMVLDRLHDLDGDGDLDNAAADLGSPDAELLARVLNVALEGSINGRFRLILHFPLLEDAPARTEGEVLLLVYRGRDTEFPEVLEDDFSGEEPMYANGSSLDACGEPLNFTRTARLDRGRLTAGPIDIDMVLGEEPAALRDARIDAVVAPDAGSMQGTFAAYATIGELGRSPFEEGTTALEFLLAGGSAVGIPTRGLTPDVDIDRDGLERVELDPEMRVEQCIDGDGFTVIEGRDCWADPRMADGFSLSFGFETTTARFAGREPGWELLAPGTCEGGPSAESLFGDVVHEGACVGPDELCDPLVAAPCCDPLQVCRGVHDRPYRCARRCVPSPCDYAGQPGFCFVGACLPLSLAMASADCTIGTGGCTTEYGVDEGTACTSVLGEAYPTCAERCEILESGCLDPRQECLDLVSEQGGYCYDLL